MWIRRAAKAAVLTVGVSLVLTSCTSAESIDLSEPAATESITAEAGESEAPVVSETAIEEAETADAGAVNPLSSSGLTGCDLMSAALVEWAQESGSLVALMNVVNVLTEIESLVAEPADRTKANLLEAQALIEDDLTATIREIPNSPIGALPDADVIACREQPLKSIYVTAKEPLGDYVGERVLSSSFSDLSGEAESIQEWGASSLLDEESWRQLAGDLLIIKVSSAQGYVEEILTALTTEE